MKLPLRARLLSRVLGFTAVLCLFVSASYGQQFTGFDVIVPKASAPNAVTVVDGTGRTMPAGRSFVIGIEGGLRNPIQFKNWTGTAAFPVMIVNVAGTGRVTISDAVPGNPNATRETGILMVHCKFIKLRGDNDPTIRYGIEIARAGGRSAGSGNRGIDVTGKSSNVELMYLEIQDVAFSGIMVKQDPSCSDLSLNYPNLVYNDIRIHDNYIHNVGAEGMYVGYSFWTTDECGSGTGFAHNIVGLRIYNNLLDECWWDGIQIGGATQDVQVINNVIMDTGWSQTNASGNGGQGIQLGGGTTGLCYSNIIIDSRTNGISLNGIGNNVVFNNLIVGGILGLFADERPAQPVSPTQPADRQTQAGTPFYVFNNTVIEPSQRAFWSMADFTDTQFNNNLAVVTTTANPFVYYTNGGVGSETGNVFQSDYSGLSFADVASYDYRILNGSVAVDQGDFMPEVTKDFTGVPRPQGADHDAGYAEAGAMSVFLRVTPPTSGNNGSINAAAINGTAPYTYSWSNGSTVNPLTNVGPGYYSVVVTDATGAKIKKATYLFTGAKMGAPVSFTPLTQVEAPTFVAPPGNYTSGQSVTILSATAGASIRYTTDGSTPTPSSGTVYSGAVSVSATGTIKAIAYKTGLDASEVSVATYLIGAPPAAPVLSITQVYDRTIQLSWTAPADANRYQLKYATTSGGPFTTLALLTGTTFEHTVTNGTNYVYVVQATSIYGASADSNQVSATAYPYASALQILSGFTVGATTTNGVSAAGAFDAQPTWDDVNRTPVGTDPGTASNTNSANKFWAVDFGTAFSGYHIVEMWTRYNVNSSGPKPGFASLWWDNDKDTVNDGITASPTLNFQSGTVPNSNTIQYWVRDRSFLSAPIVPLDRYLVVSIGATTTNKPNEFAFVGWKDGAAAAPVVTQQPASQSAPVGASITLSVGASGSPVPTFQWRKNGVNISGATAQTLVLNNVQASDAASYSVVATNASGSVTSNNAVITVTGTVPTLVILTPSAVGTATGSLACTAAGAFNEQPTWDSVNAIPVGVAASPHATTTTAYANRFWFIDFGANWANIRITQMWTRYRPTSSGSYSGYAQFWWDDDKDTINDGVTASTMNFQNGTGLPSVSTQLWVRDRDFSASPITPQGRYLMVSNGAAPSDRANEFAFVGYVVP